LLAQHRAPPPIEIVAALKKDFPALLASTI